MNAGHLVEDLNSAILARLIGRITNWQSI